jgi:hypothetical protein
MIIEEHHPATKATGETFPPPMTNQPAASDPVYWASVKWHRGNKSHELT